jgi:hypothetical protein
MTFLTKHWLGLAVLICLAWVALGLAADNPKGAAPAAILFWCFFVPWLIRGFLRFAGRAWHHSTKTSTSEPR